MGRNPKMNPRSLVFFMMVVIQLTACSKSESDFDVICDSFVTLRNLESYSHMSSGRRSDWVLEDALTKITPRSNSFRAWSVIANATPSERYGLFVSAAEASGYADWGCDAMRIIAHEVGSG